MSYKFATVGFASLTSFAILLLAGCAPLAATATVQPHAAPAQPSVQPSLVPPSPEPTLAPVATQPPAATQEPTQAAAPVEVRSNWVAFIAADGNLTLLDPLSNQRKQITQDGAAPMQPPDAVNPSVYYCCDAWSSDGKLLAYRATTQVPAPDHTDFHYALWVYDTATGQSKKVLEAEEISSFSWHPGSHLLALDQMVDPNYFVARGKNDLSKARGLLGLNVDTGEKTDLVKPEKGFSLVAPQWSPDGRYLGFDEVLYMEGRGNFAYYDFQANQYTAWGKVIGGYAWSPDKSHIAYDHLAYNPNGDERIRVSDLEGKNEQILSPKDGPMAYSPAYSPKGDLLAYQMQAGDPAANQYALMVQPLNGGEALKLGAFDQLGSITWSPDETQILFSSGPYEKNRLSIVSLANGSVQALEYGYSPAWQPLPAQ